MEKEGRLEQNKERSRIPLAGMGEGWQRRLLVCTIGVVFQGFFLSFLLEVNIGTDSCTFFVRSLSEGIGCSFGNCQLIFNVILLILVFLVSRFRYLGFGTLVNATVIGYVCDFCRFLWGKLIPESVFRDIVPRVLIFIAALACFLVATAVYMNVQMGLSPYDAPASIVSGYAKKVPFFIIRMIWDYLFIFIGFFVGGVPTVGTLIMSVTLGPVISFVGRVLRTTFHFDRLLQKQENT